MADGLEAGQPAFAFLKEKRGQRAASRGADIMMMVMEGKTKTRSGGQGVDSLGTAVVLVERPAGVPKAEATEAICRIILRIERAQRNSLFKEEGPEFMEKLCLRIDQLEALVLSSSATSREGKLAVYGLELIRDKGPPELKEEAARILGRQPSVEVMSWERAYEELLRSEVYPYVSGECLRELLKTEHGSATGGYAGSNIFSCKT
jgi:hypothetical protein